MKVVPYKGLWLTLSALLVTASIGAVATFGLRLSADFTEGTLIAVHFTEEAADMMEGEEAPAEGEEAAKEMNSTVSIDELKNFVESAPLAEGSEEVIGSAEIKQGSDGSFIIKMRRLPDGPDYLLASLESELGGYDLLQSRDVSPVFAETFRQRAFQAIAVACIVIVLYITFAFRGVSRGIKSWKLGAAAIIALVHDVVIIVGVYALLGQYYAVEIDALFITALLSVLGFSVNDTIVVFDRVRENLLHRNHSEAFEVTAERSLQQTMARSINTSLSTFFVLLCLLLLGASEIYYFVLALILGVAVGTYSSIFLATPLLTIFQKSEK